MRVLAVISSAALILSGVWCFANFGVSFMGMAFIIGLVLVFAGLAGALVFMKTDFGNRVVKDSLNWFLAETIIFFILGFVVFVQQIGGGQCDTICVRFIDTLCGDYARDRVFKANQGCKVFMVIHIGIRYSGYFIRNLHIFQFYNDGDSHCYRGRGIAVTMRCEPYDFRGSHEFVPC